MASLGEIKVDLTQEMREAFAELSATIQQLRDDMRSPDWLVTHVNPGDVIILRVAESLTLANIRELQEWMSHIWPDNQIVVLDGDLSIEVFRQDENPEEMAKAHGADTGL